MSGMKNSKVDIASVADRVVSSLGWDFEALCSEQASNLAPLVESEIELMVLTSLLVTSRLAHINFYVGEKDPSGPRDIRIIPQYQWKNYRIDFCICAYRRDPIFIECDGHDFHERTKDQAKRDRSKDRAIQSAGIKIFRFTGSEIWKDAGQIVIDICGFLGGSVPSSKSVDVSQAWRPQ